MIRVRFNFCTPRLRCSSQTYDQQIIVFVASHMRRQNWQANRGQCIHIKVHVDVATRSYIIIWHWKRLTKMYLTHVICLLVSGRWSQFKNVCIFNCYTPSWCETRCVFNVHCLANKNRISRSVKSLRFQFFFLLKTKRLRLRNFKNMFSTKYPSLSIPEVQAV